MTTPGPSSDEGRRTPTVFPFTLILPAPYGFKPSSGILVPLSTARPFDALPPGALGSLLPIVFVPSSVGASSRLSPIGNRAAGVGSPNGPSTVTVRGESTLTTVCSFTPMFVPPVAPFVIVEPADLVELDVGAWVESRLASTTLSSYEAGALPATVGEVATRNQWVWSAILFRYTFRP